MKSRDFEYDGLTLASMGYMLCRFGNGGLETIQNGSQIKINTIPSMNGSVNHRVSSEYSECLTATFQICKNACLYDEMELTTNEIRELTGWLNREDFHRFKILDDAHLDLYYMATFNVSKLEIDGTVYGLELEMITNSPFAFRDEHIVMIKNTTTNGKHSITDPSNKDGFIYPVTEITVTQSGNLSMYNALEDRTTYVGNCIAGEVITMDYPIIKSSIASHKIENDFNWNFFRIANTFKSKTNDLTISIPCTIKLTYSPIIKMGI